MLKVLRPTLGVKFFRSHKSFLLTFFGFRKSIKMIRECLVLYSMSGYILESKGSIQYYCKRADLDLLFQKTVRNSFLKEKGTF